ncbi:MAG: hypothetical protein ACTSYF_15010 [Promethearchaeota archaeon]
MLINLFEIKSVDDWIVFSGKNRCMCLTFFQINKPLSIKEIFESLFKNTEIYNYDCYKAIQIHYNKNQKHIFLSLNLVTEDIINKLKKINKSLESIKKRTDIRTEPDLQLENVYFNILRGVDDFKLRFNKNNIEMKSILNNRVLLNLAIFEIKLYNLTLVPNFFTLLNDLAIKLDLNIDLLFMVKYNNKTVLLKSYLIYSEANKVRFQDTIKRLKGLNDSEIMLKELKMSKKLLSKILLRRPFSADGFFPIDDFTDFLIRHVKLNNLNKPSGLFNEKIEAIELNDLHNGDVIKIYNEFDDLNAIDEDNGVDNEIYCIPSINMIGKQGCSNLMDHVTDISEFHENTVEVMDKPYLNEKRDLLEMPEEKHDSIDSNDQIEFENLKTTKNIFSDASNPDTKTDSLMKTNDSINSRKIEEDILYKFWKSIEDESGYFLDEEKYIFEMENQILVIAYYLNLNVLNQLVERFAGFKKLILIFLNINELQEFKNNIYQSDEILNAISWENYVANLA